MEIPESFKLFGSKISVRYDQREFINNTESMGYASYRTNSIVLNPVLLNDNKEIAEQTFLHEVVHFILYHAGSAHTKKDDHMHRDEDFVDLVASLLHQVLTTQEGSNASRV